MSKNQGGSSGTQVVQSQTNLPSWVNGASEDNYNFAKSTADNLMGPYTGNRVAGLTPGALDNIGQLQGAVGGANPGYNAAQTTLSGLQKFDPSHVTPGQIANTDLSKYMNPFTQNVVDASMKSLDIARRQGLNQIGDQANASKAFGGSRHGVAEGVLDSEAARQGGALTANLQSQNFGNALSMAGQDIGTRLQGDIANQNADMTGAGVRLNAANSGANVAGQQQQSLLQSLMGSLQGQSMIQGNDQQKLDAQRQLHTEQQQYPLQQLQIRLGALGQSPYGSSTTQTSSLPPGNGLMQGLGAGATGLGLLGSMFGQNGAFPMIGASSMFA